MTVIFFLLCLLPLSAVADSYVFPEDAVEIEIDQRDGFEHFILTAPETIEVKRLDSGPNQEVFEIVGLTLSKSYNFHPTSSQDYEVRLKKGKGKALLMLGFKSSPPHLEMETLDSIFVLELQVPDGRAHTSQLEPRAIQNKDLDFQLSAESVYLEGRYELEVTNTSKHRLQLNVSLQTVRYPGTQSEMREPSSDILLQPSSLSLYPSRTEKISLVNLMPAPLRELLYELQITPIEESSHKKVEIEVGGEKKSLTFGAGVRVPVFLAPRQPRYKLLWKQDGEVLHIENSGTVSALFSKGNFCKDMSSQLDCLQLPPFRVYPGNKVGLPVSAAISGKMIRTVQGRSDSVQIYR